MNTEFITQEDIKAAEKEYSGKLKFGPVGNFVDLRTYRRWNDRESRRETLFERNARVTNYSCSLGLEQGEVSFDSLQAEAYQLFNSLNEFQVSSSGRTMWCGGTKAAEDNPESQFNCSGLAINRVGALPTLAGLLMLGVGVGLRVFFDDVNQLPSIKQRPSFHLKEYFPVKANQRLESTEVYIKDNKVHIVVGDSREGWVDALKAVLDLHLQPTKDQFDLSIVVDFDNVRPIGERLMTFGGTSSGPGALKDIIKSWLQIFSEVPKDRLRPIDCGDFACSAAKGIAMGGKRRSALMILFSETDELMASAKANLMSPDMKHKMYRFQSNNTLCVGSEHLDDLKQYLESNPDTSLSKAKDFIDRFKPSKEWFKSQFDIISKYGDPGLNNFLLMTTKRWIAVRQRRPGCPVHEIWSKYCQLIVNPCSEILLNIGFDEDVFKTGKKVSFCNLTTIFLQNFYQAASNSVNMDALEKAIRLTVRIGCRQTCVDMNSPELNDTQKEERLLGVSATGWIQLFSLLGWKTNSQEVKDFLSTLRRWANEEAEEYSEKLGIPTPLLVTCNKPEGTLSKVAGSSEGLHWDWSPYSILRIESSTQDAITQTLVDQGFPWYPKPYEFSDGSCAHLEGSSVLEKIATFDTLSEVEKQEILKESLAVLFEFPLKSDCKVAAGDVPVITQLENIQCFLNYYTDHIPSSTITVKPEEWDTVSDWMFENWRDFATAAFLSYWSGNLPLLPKEDITEEEYYQLKSKFDPKYQVGDSFIVDEKLLARYENRNLQAGIDIDDVELGQSCETGACPIR